MTTTRRSTFAAALRTTILLATLTGLLVVIGFAIGGPSTALAFLVIGALINLGAFWFSDRIALRMAGAKPISENDAPGLYRIVRELTTRADLPMPSIYVIPQDQPNAFATGRSPKRSAVAVTSGIMKLLSEDELRGSDLTRARPHPAPRHPDAVGCRDGRRRDHLDRLHDAVVRRRGRVAAQHRRLAGDGAAGSDRRLPDPARDLAPARVRGRCDRGRDLRQSRVARLRAAAARRRAPRRSRCRSTRPPSLCTS